MRFGCCTTIDNAPAVIDAGYDFIELAVGPHLMPEAPDREWAPVRTTIEKAGIQPAAFNVMVPASIKITGPDASPERLRRYVNTVFHRASLLGGEVVVFGSGGARSVPDGFPREQAWQQLVQFVRWAGDAALAAGMTLVIEPLNQGESNVLNSIPEAIELAEAASHPAVQVLADLYHIMVDEEPIDDVLAAGSRLRHVHVADSERLYPGSGSYPYPAFFGALKQIGYDRAISVECRWGDFEKECAEALAFLRKTWDEA
ncbi:MAG: hypothetical protein Kow0047_23900 [Anaerolineae bacterium]